MKLTPEIRKQIVKHESNMDSDKGKEFGCPPIVYFLFKWVDKKTGNVWTSEAYPYYKDEEEAINHFWKMVCVWI